MTDRVTTICRAVAREHGLALADLMRPTHERRIARPRQIAMALCREMTNRSLPKLASYFAGDVGEAKHHTTVLWAVRRCAALRASNSAFEATYQNCRARAESFLGGEAQGEEPEPEPAKGKSGYSQLRDDNAWLRKRVAELEFQVAVYSERERRADALESVYKRARSPKACASGRASA